MKRNNNIKIFDSFKINNEGIVFFVPNNTSLYKKKKACHGFGQIKYLEGSIYTGEVYFDGKYYHKLGYGKQDFTYSTLGNIDPVINEKIYMFVGYFDYRKTNWIYGNGVLYYRDINNNPSRFVKGFFSCLDKIEEYKGEFNYSLLIDGYNKEMESDYVKKFSLIENEIKDLNNIKDYYTLFIGDSYFEFWHYKEFANITFKELFDNSKYLNIGVGGTKFSDWNELIEQINYFPNFKNIVINLGFNDLHYSKKNTSLKVFESMCEFINKLNKQFNNPNIYVLTICHSPLHPSFVNKENNLNKLIKKNAKKLGITVIDNSKVIEERNNKINVYHIDNCHLNEFGYEVMLNEINKYIK